ncbi:hypothetical protein HYT92_00070 [Candidatus Pacearchaeota archaeon]|nr:hypothetical protein [Candidatus Pacearchaeota archaeon]
MCVGRRINEDGTSDLKEADPDTKAFFRRVKGGIKDIAEIPFYKIGSHGQKKNNLTTFHKR